MLMPAYGIYYYNKVGNDSFDTAIDKLVLFKV